MNPDRGDGHKVGPSFASSLLAVFLISFSVLTFEVALTRVFSVMLTYHFVFAIVSSAMLGLGLGGLVFRRWGRRRPERALWAGSFILALSLVGSLLIILIIPVGDTEGVRDLLLWVYLILALVPFVAAGFVMSGLFQRFSRRSSLLYGADLVGAAGGAVAVVPGMDATGPVNLVIITALVAIFGACLLGRPGLRRVLRSVAAAFLLAGLLSASLAGWVHPSVPIAPDPDKDMGVMLSDPTIQTRVVESRWSSFGRTDLVEIASDPVRKYLFVDGAAGSVMYDLDALLTNPEIQMELTMHSGELFPFRFLKDEDKETALILGPGGGRDVAAALLGGVRQITAVEVNPDVVRMVRDYEDFSGGIYSGRPGITAVVGEARNYVRTSTEKFDLIMAAIPVTKSSRSVEGYALTENNLFTVEAFGDYLDHLNPNGRIIVVAHDDEEIYKLVALALGALGRQGLSGQEAMTHLYTVASDMMPALVVQKEPLSALEAEAVHAGLHVAGFDQGVLFVPGVNQQLSASAPGAGGAVYSMLDPLLYEISQGSPSAGVFAKISDVDLKPTTDDRPFFYKFSPGLPSPFPVFAVLLGLAVATLAVLLGTSQRRGPVPRSFVGAIRASSRLKAYLALFFTLGLAYMLVEIALFQRLSLYVSQPQMALTILLFSLLLGGGIGSLLTSFMRRRRLAAGAVIALGVAVAVPVLTLTFSRVFALGADPRLTAVMMILPLGMLMGCLFPVGVASLSRDGFETHTSVMWGVNGGVSVLGSALAMIIGISWGFSRALFVGAALYLLIGVLFALLARRGNAGLRNADGALSTR